MTKPQLIHHKVKLTKNNAKKLAKGENTLLKHEQILDGEHDLFLTPVQSKKLMRNARRGKGVKLHLSPGELDHSLKKGKGLSDLLSRGYKAVRPRLRRALHTGIDKYAPRLEAEVERRVKTVTRRVKPALHKGIDLALGPDETEGGKLSWKGFKRGFSREYKQHVKPIVAPIIRQGLKTAIKTGLPALAVMTGQPQLAPMAGIIADKYGDQGIDALGKATGAFGLKKGRRGRVAKKAPLSTAIAKSTIQGQYFSNILPLDHPALKPGDTRLKQGGSFLPAGGRGFKPAGY